MFRCVCSHVGSRSNVSSYICSHVGSRSNVSVPIAAANSLPSSVKARHQAGSIYTSIPVHGQQQDGLYPTIIPVAQKAPDLSQRQSLSSLVAIAAAVISAHKAMLLYC